MFELEHFKLIQFLLFLNYFGCLKGIVKNLRIMMNFSTKTECYENV